MSKQKNLNRIKNKNYHKLTQKQQKIFCGILDFGYCQIYLFNGKKHRIDGPAIIWSNNMKSYYLYGEKVTKEEQELYYDLMKLKGIEDD